MLLCNVMGCSGEKYTEINYIFHVVNQVLITVICKESPEHITGFEKHFYFKIQ